MWTTVTLTLTLALHTLIQVSAGKTFHSIFIYIYWINKLYMLYYVLCCFKFYQSLQLQPILVLNLFPFPSCISIL